MVELQAIDSSLAQMYILSKRPNLLFIRVFMLVSYCPRQVVKLRFSRLESGGVFASTFRISMLFRQSLHSTAYPC